MSNGRSNAFVAPKAPWEVRLAKWWLWYGMGNHNGKRYMLRRMLAEIPLSSEVRQQVILLYEEAAELTKRTGIQHHIHHVHPLTHSKLCGLHVPWNMAVVTQAENYRLGNAFSIEHLEQADLFVHGPQD